MIRTALCTSMVLAVACGLSAVADEPVLESAPAVYSKSGADACLTCHASESVTAIFKSPHAALHEPSSPLSEHACESCHGPLGDKLPMHGDAVIGFGEGADTPTETQNAMCLDCHQQARGHWENSTHGAEELACASCHTVHTDRDPVLSMVDQADTCFGCHLKQQGQFARPYAHPVRSAKMNCSTCHDPHGSSSDFELVRATLNETCYGCHAEKRGPFVFEHPPVSEDCSNCHQAHGSSHPAMLTKTSQLLCQQCHSQRGHPSIRSTSSGLPDDSPSSFVLLGRCVNCHSAVHGSNHPSGITLTR